MSGRMRCRAWATLSMLLVATLIDFVIRYSAINNNTIGEVSELTEGSLLIILISFGAFSLCLRFKTYLLFYIFAATAFGLVTAMTQAMIEISKLTMQDQSTTLSQYDILYRAITNIILSICCFVSAVCFYFYRDSLIMFDFGK